MRLPTILILAAMLTAPVVAGELIHFTSGTTMEIQGHHVEDGMIHVDLGGGSSIAFPVSMIDEITRHGSNVYNANVVRRSSNVVSSGVRGAGRSGGNSGQGSAIAAAAAALDKLNEMNFGADRDLDRGVIYPQANHQNVKARQIGIQGDMRMYGRAAAQRPRKGSNATMRNANIVTTPSGNRILGGVPDRGTTAHLGGEVTWLGLSNRALASKVANGTADDPRYVPGTTPDD